MKSPVTLPTLYTQDSSISGSGVFAREAIGKDQLITKMEGLPASEEEIIERIQSGTLALDDPLQIQEWEYLILSPFHRLFNHSCEPNAGIRQERKLVAIRDLKPNEEITFDYSTTVGMNIRAEHWSMPCLCGHSLCRKVIGNVSTLSQSTIQFYLNRGVLPDFIQRQLEASESFDENS